MLIIFSLLTVFNCLLAWPVVWCTLAPRRWVLWLVVAGVCCVGLTVAEILAIQAAIGRGGDEEVFWIMNLLQAAGASVALLAVRAAGFRLIRSSLGESSHHAPS